MSLLNRLFFDKVNTEVEEEFMALPNIENIENPIENPIEIIQKGGKVKDNKMHYIQRWNLYLFIFFLLVVLLYF